MKKSRILSAILALAMIFTALVPVLATAAAPNSTEVVIHKIEMPTIDDTWPRGGGATGDAYDGSELPSITDYFGADAKELAGVYFTRYAVSKTEYDAMVANPGNFDTAEKVIAAYPGLTGVEVGPTTNTGLSVTLPDGYYWFVEDTSRPLPDGRTISDNAAVPFGLALPMYKSDGTTFTTGTNALHLYPKNTATKPEIDKNFAQTNGLLDSTDLTTIEGGADYANYQADKATATAHVGQEVPYEVKTRIPAGTNYQKLVWTDVMTNGLTYNKDLVITAGTLNLTAGTDYTLT